MKEIIRMKAPTVKVVITIKDKKIVDCVREERDNKIIRLKMKITEKMMLILITNKHRKQ